MNLRVRLHTFMHAWELREEAQQKLSFPTALIFVGLGAHTLFIFACWEDFSAILCCCCWKNKSSWNNLCLAVPLCDVHEIAGDANLHPGFFLDNGNRRRCHKWRETNKQHTIIYGRQGCAACVRAHNPCVYGRGKVFQEKKFFVRTCFWKFFVSSGHCTGQTIHILGAAINEKCTPPGDALARCGKFSFRCWRRRLSVLKVLSCCLLWRQPPISWKEASLWHVCWAADKRIFNEIVCEALPKIPSCHKVIGDRCPWALRYVFSTMLGLANWKVSQRKMDHKIVISSPRCKILSG